MPGSGTLRAHRIIGRGTRFESQFGPASNWTNAWSGGFYGNGPWVSVMINGDWETQKVASLGTSGSYAEYVMVLENSFRCGRPARGEGGGGAIRGKGPRSRGILPPTMWSMSDGFWSDVPFSDGSCDFFSMPT